MPAPDPHIMIEALAYGVVGKRDEGLALLQPIVDQGPRETFALLSALAEATCKRARDRDGPDAAYDLVVEVADGTVSSDLLPPDIRFAGQFITSWGNRQFETAHDLFWAMAEPSDRNGTSVLADSISAVYELAVCAAREIVSDRVRQRVQDGGTQ
ncbi:hypothetical protein GCM10010387_16220 [Streptomyces inusitatus]|uniref:Uncharacterized protein n=1 Tax=Streptomyces inusitatus TaxID=68221 RepID=A0A918PV08_9ACTN|nr:hypothetical protein [Streptomyces inusitatus]GGZ23749.1 hypothetical protein GCM10010387_16220 [Streptomyces inusitatus]